MPKKAIKVPAARTGRGVRWTLEVTANVDGAARADRTSSARGPAKSEKKPSRGKATATGEKTGSRSAAPTQAATKTKGRRQAPHVSAAATRHIVVAPAPAIVAPAMVLPQSAVAVASASESSPAWPTTAAAPDGADVHRGRDNAEAAFAGTVQTGPVVRSQLVSRQGSHVGSRTGHQNALKMVAAAVIAVAIVTALALTHDPSARSSVALSAAPATSASAIDSTDVSTEDLSRPVARESRKSELTSTLTTTAATVSPDTKAAPEKPKPSRDARLTTTAASPSATVATVPVAPPTAASAPDTPVAKPVTAEANAATPALEASRSAGAQPSVTITGCLETDGERFRLTETDGTDAPKSRGWRSGFLKKKPAPVELVAFSDPAALRKYVGHRVVATGPLESRSLQVRSFQPSGAMCD